MFIVRVCAPTHRLLLRVLRLVSPSVIVVGLVLSAKWSLRRDELVLVAVLRPHRFLLLLPSCVLGLLLHVELHRFGRLVRRLRLLSLLELLHVGVTEPARPWLFGRITREQVEVGFLRPVQLLNAGRAEDLLFRLLFVRSCDPEEIFRVVRHLCVAELFLAREPWILLFLHDSVLEALADEFGTRILFLVAQSKVRDVFLRG